MTLRAYEMSDKEIELFQEASEKTHAQLSETVAVFISHCLDNGMQPSLAGAGLSHYMLSNLIRALAVCSGMPAEDLDNHDDAVTIIANRVQKNLMVKVSEFVRTHVDDEDRYVSPEDRKRNDAAEKADYEYDRDKEERIDNSRN